MDINRRHFLQGAAALFGQATVRPLSFVPVATGSAPLLANTAALGSLGDVVSLMDVNVLNLDMYAQSSLLDINMCVDDVLMGDYYLSIMQENMANLAGVDLLEMAREVRAAGGVPLMNACLSYNPTFAPEQLLEIWQAEQLPGLETLERKGVRSLEELISRYYAQLSGLLRAPVPEGYKLPPEISHDEAKLLKALCPPDASEHLHNAIDDALKDIERYRFDGESTGRFIETWRGRHAHEDTRYAGYEHPAMTVDTAGAECEELALNASPIRKR